MLTKYSLIAFPQWYFEGKAKYGKKGFQDHSRKWSADSLKKCDISNRSFMITGANAGIGFEITKELAQYGAKKIHMVCRNMERGAKAREDILNLTFHDQPRDETRIELHIVDMSSFGQIKDFAQNFISEKNHLDVFIHNAGVMMEKRVETTENHEVTMATMLGGSYLLSGLLLPLLKKSNDGRIINISSAGQYLVGLETEDLNLSKLSKYDGVLVYSIAKRAQLALTQRWALELAGSNVTVHCMHPGWTDTPGLRVSMPSFHEKQKKELRNLQEGADTAVWLAMAPEVAKTSGKFWFDREIVRSHMPLAMTKYADKDIDVLWKNCAAYCNWQYDASILRRETSREVQEKEDRL